VELALPEYSSLKHPYSLLAAAAIYAASTALGRSATASDTSTSSSLFFFCGNNPVQKRLAVQAPTPLHAHRRLCSHHPPSCRLPSPPARATCPRSPAFPAALERHSGYSESVVREVASELTRLHNRAPSHSLTAVFKKWSSEKQQAVASVLPPASLLGEGEQLSASWAAGVDAGDA
jgi:hypothetical protein